MVAEAYAESEIWQIATDQLLQICVLRELLSNTYVNQ